MKQPSYNFYPSLLDSFIGYRDCEEVWLQYWGQSDTPKKSLAEFQEEKRLDLIDKINRKGMEWEDAFYADRGTAFNEVIDRIITGSKENTDQVTIGRVGETICAAINRRMFYFDATICKNIAGKYMTAVPQVLCNGTLLTSYGNVRLYGYIDELMSDYIVDLKTSKSYSVGKFKKNMQHLVYPFCMQQAGQEIKHFIYDIAIFSDKTGEITELYEEVYPYYQDEAEQKLKAVCEEFIEFIEKHRELITDKKIFNQHGTEENIK